MARVAVAYVRRSKVETDSPGNISRETQLAAIRSRAAIDGHNGTDPLVIFEDWGRSGRRAKRHLRTEYGRMLAMIEADEVSTVYAYNWSRLGRSTRDILALADICKAHDTAIVTATGQSVDPTKADGRMLLTILTAVDEWQAEVQAERTAGVLAAWRDEHPDERLGRKPYGEDPDRPEEDVSVVLAAFEEAGSFLGACKRLSEAGVATRTGGRWDVRTVGRIVRRAQHVREGHSGEADACPICHTGQRGVRTRATRIFSGLLRCHCGAMLTTMPRRDASVGYYCKSGHVRADHPRPYVVAETKVRAWAEEQTEAVRKLVGLRDAPDADELAAERVKLTAQRERIVDMYADGTIRTKADRDRRLATIRAKLDRLDASESVASTFAPSGLVSAPMIDWSADPGTVNAQLKRLWRVVHMNRALLPARAEWIATDYYGEEGPE